MSTGLDNLRNAADGMRKATIAPPTTTPTPPAETQPTAPPSAEQQPPPDSPKQPGKKQKRPKRKPAARTRDRDTLPGKAVGAQQYLRVNLSAPARQHLQHLADTTTTSLGEQAIGALNRHHTTITNQATTTQSRGGLTPPRTTTRRLIQGGNKIATTIGLTPEEAQAVEQLQADTNYSYSLLFDTALRLDGETTTT